jgi:hypothetical protein
VTNYPPGMKMRPIDQWPGVFTAERRISPFQASFTDTLQLLEKELRLLHPKDRQYPPSVLQVAIPESKFRLDGMPYASATPDHPGVIVSIEPRNKPAMSLPCDTFTHWHSNLRAIALTLEALRKIDRYGVTKNGQQYRGWQAIEQKGSHPAWSAEEAEQFLRGLVRIEGKGLDHLDTLPQVYRRVKGQTHPDRNGGDQTLWDKVQHAAGVLTAAGAL